MVGPWACLRVLVSMGIPLRALPGVLLALDVDQDLPLQGVQGLVFVGVGV
jgi:hypothetical protein